MYAELTAAWQRLAKAKFTRHILPIWSESQFKCQPVSKSAETILVKSCFRQNYTRTFLAEHSNIKSTLCRLCKAEPETIEHLFMECKAAETQRTILRKAMGDQEFTLKSILGTEQTLRHTEIFISKSNFVTLL